MGLHNLACLALVGIAACDAGAARPPGVALALRVEGPNIPTASAATFNATATSSAPVAEPLASSVATADVRNVEEIPGLRRPTTWGAERALSGSARMAQAERLRLPVVKQLFADAGVAFPPRQLLLRGFKRERHIEVWAASKTDGPLTRIATYEVCYASGTLGPKRREGDRQVPEGFYRVAMFNPQSLYHLAMLVSYPNQSDRVLSNPVAPGSEIMIHGDCVSIGCLAMSDERAEELWLMARAAPAVQIHLLPTRKMDELLASDEGLEHHTFWANLREGFTRFEKNHVLPKVRVAGDGRYSFD